jgi:hypothetical protein
MKLRIEWEDDPVFATVKYNGSDYRALTLKIKGKPFSTWVTLDVVYQYRRDDPNYMREIDRSLIGAMERMFEKIFMDAIGAIPDGTDLMINRGEGRDG